MAVQKQPTSSYNPYFGCAIMVVAALIFGGFIAWSAYTLFKQDAEIDRITGPEPATLPSHGLSETELSDLSRKLGAFRDAAPPASLELSLAELNALLTLAPDLGSGTYDQMVHFTGTEPESEALLASISLPLNRLQFWEDQKRYLVADATFTLEVEEDGPDARITDLRIPGIEVPTGFIESQRSWTWVSPYRENLDLAPTLRKIQQIEVTDSGLILSTAP